MKLTLRLERDDGSLLEELTINPVAKFERDYDDLIVKLENGIRLLGFTFTFTPRIAKFYPVGSPTKDKPLPFELSHFRILP